MGLMDLSSMKYFKTKKQISNDDRFFGTRVKQYASARMAVGIKIDELQGFEISRNLSIVNCGKGLRNEHETFSPPITKFYLSHPL